MARVGIVFGLVLCGLTFVALVWTPAKSPTQFIPMMLGIPILFCGVVALNPHRRRHAMHGASLIALLGAVVGAALCGQALMRRSRGAQIDHAELNLVVAMIIACALFMVICVVSFIATRRRKQDEAVAGSRTINLRQAAETDAETAKVNPRESA